jgi:hypothetical protein
MASCESVIVIVSPGFTTAQLQRFDQGRNAFYNWIKSSLQANKKYNQMATELIASKGTNSFVQGDVNFLLGSKTTGGPLQDDYDQETADVVGIRFSLTLVPVLEGKSLFYQAKSKVLIVNTDWFGCSLLTASH